MERESINSYSEEKALKESDKMRQKIESDHS